MCFISPVFMRITETDCWIWFGQWQDVSICFVLLYYCFAGISHLLFGCLIGLPQGMYLLVMIWLLCGAMWCVYWYFIAFLCVVSLCVLACMCVLWRWFVVFDDNLIEYSHIVLNVINVCFSITYVLSLWYNSVSFVNVMYISYLYVLLQLAAGFYLKNNS